VIWRALLVFFPHKEASRDADLSYRRPWDTPRPNSEAKLESIFLASIKVSGV
jgi:hypothetical protein